MAAEDDADKKGTHEADADTKPADAAPPLDLQLHHLLRSLQLQHGLRHGDYQRYRHYTTRRLARLRKAGKATHKGGKAFAAKQVHTLASLGGDPAAVQMEHLLLLLLNAERAWAFAMQVKQDAAGSQHMPSYLRAHVLRRLHRAAVWATRLQGLVGEASGRVTERTALEVAAYAGWMAAGVDVEQEQWARALGKLRTAHSILSQLGEVGSLEEQDLFSSKAEEVLQSARYCQYNLGEGSIEDLKVGLGAGTGGEHVPQALREKLEAVLEASRTQAATGLEAVDWGGRRLPVSSADVRVALVKVDETRQALAAVAREESDEAKREAQYTAVYAALDEAGRRVAEEAAKLEGMSHGARVEAQKEELRLLASYLQHGKLETMRLRNEGLVQSLLRAGRAGGGGKQAGGRPEDLVHVLDALLQNATEALGLPGVEDVESVLTQAQALQARYRAQRAFYLAEFYATNAATAGGKSESRLAEALALYERAEELAQTAVGLAGEVVEARKGEREGMRQAAQEVEAMAAGGRCRTQALALLASLPPAAVGEEAALTAALSALSLSAATAAAAAAAAARGEGEGEEGGKVQKKQQQQQQQKKSKKKQQPPQQPGKGKAGTGKAASSGLGAGVVPASRTLLERLGELDGGKEVSGFGIAHVPPIVTPVRAKPQLFDMTFNFLEGRLPDLAAKAGLPTSSKKKGGGGGGANAGSGGGGLFGWLRG